MDKTLHPDTGADFVIAGPSHRSARDGILEDTAIVAWRERVSSALAATRRTSLNAEAAAQLTEAEAALGELFHTLLEANGAAHLQRGWERVVRVPVIGHVA